MLCMGFNSTFNELMNMVELIGDGMTCMGVGDVWYPAARGNRSFKKEKPQST